MTVYINGTTGYSGPVGTIGDLTTTGNTTLGDASGDTLTLNGNTASIPNNLNFTGGNIGIGITPTTILDVGANNNTPKTISLRYSTVPAYFTNSYDGTVGLTTISCNSYNTSSGSSSWSSFANAGYGNAAVQIATSTGGADIRFLTAAAANTNPTERMRLDSSGNLGVGTTSPSTYGILAVAGSAGAASSPVNALSLVNTSDGSVALNFVNAVTSTANPLASIRCLVTGTGAGTDDGVLAFYTAANATSSERARIDSSGVLLVNATSRANASDHTAIKLAVFGEAHLQQQGCHLWFGDSTNASPLGIGEGLVNTVGTDQDFMSVYYRASCRFFTGTSEVARFDNSSRLLQLAGRKSSAYGAASNQQMWVGTVSSIANGGAFSLFYINGIYDNLEYELDMFINAGGYFAYKSAGIFGYNGFSNTVLGASSSQALTKTGTLYNETMTITNNQGATINQYIICLRVWGYNTTANISTGGADLIVSSYLTRIE